MAGRALWQEATQISPRADRTAFFKYRTAARLRELTKMAEKWGSPWFARLGSRDGGLGELPEGWYKEYPA
jgi:hypothetical protein